MDNALCHCSKSRGKNSYRGTEKKYRYCGVVVVEKQKPVDSRVVDNARDIAG